jgi:flagellar biosynthetic protein FliO
VRTLAALAFTLGLIAAAAWLLRRYQGLPSTSAQTSTRLKIIEKKNLNPTTTLYLVQHDDAEHLIASTTNQTTLLHTRKKVQKK